MVILRRAKVRTTPHGITSLILKNPVTSQQFYLGTQHIFQKIIFRIVSAG